jgi:hypothetical protein
MAIKFYSKVKKIENKKRIKRGWKDGHGEEQFEYEDMGWFILLEGSWEYLYVGGEKPEGFSVGDEVEVIIQRKT